MPYRKVPLVKNELYHICSKSIAEFVIFNNDKEYERMLDLISFCSLENTPYKFSIFKKFKEKKKEKQLKQLDYSKKLIEIIAYCLMPTHIHFILKQLKREGISEFLKRILQSYSQYFNKKHKRKGPLWESRFRNALIETDEQFLHVTRYVHLNPVTAHLVETPEDWKYSSYGEYIGLVKKIERICDFSDYLHMDVKHYKEFVNNQIEYQRDLASVKHLTLE